MSEKSWVAIEQHICFVCGIPFDTGAVLLDKHMKESFEDKHAITGYGLCEQHNKLKEDGYIALIEATKSPAGDAVRTGTFAHIKQEAFAKVFNEPVPEKMIAFVEPEVIQILQSMVAPEPAEES